MALSQVEYNKKSLAKRGITQKTFGLDQETIATLGQITQQTGQTQSAVVKAALQHYLKTLQVA